MPVPIALILALQAATTAANGTAGPPPRIDLLQTPPPCNDSGQGEVVVCGRRDLDRYRLRALPPAADTAPLVAETGLVGDLKGSATVDRRDMPGGTVSNRVMLNLKLPF
jgi:hypothetical protein